MKKQNVFLCFCLTVLFVKAQTVTPIVYSNGGNYNSAAGGSISWTVGEPVSETYTTTNNKTTMGFHQPELGVATLMKEQGGDKEVLVYPNPGKESLSINFKDLENGNYKIQLLDAMGKLVFTSDMEINDPTKKIELNVSSYAEGNYFLRLSNSSFNKTVKITKTH